MSVVLEGQKSPSSNSALPYAALMEMVNKKGAFFSWKLNSGIPRVTADCHVVEVMSYLLILTFSFSTETFQLSALLPERKTNFPVWRAGAGGWVEVFPCMWLTQS